MRMHTISDDTKNTHPIVYGLETPYLLIRDGYLKFRISSELSSRAGTAELVMQ
jgi:hypothetical protein